MIINYKGHFAKGAYIKVPTLGFVTMFVVRETKEEGGGIHRHIKHLTFIMRMRRMLSTFWNSRTDRISSHLSSLICHPLTSPQKEF